MASRAGRGIRLRLAIYVVMAADVEQDDLAFDRRKVMVTR
jgi:hypothetical protein